MKWMEVYGVPTWSPCQSIPAAQPALSARPTSCFWSLARGIARSGVRWARDSERLAGPPWATRSREAGWASRSWWAVRSVEAAGWSNVIHGRQAWKKRNRVLVEL